MAIISILCIYNIFAIVFFVNLLFSKANVIVNGFININTNTGLTTNISATFSYNSIYARTSGDASYKGSPSGFNVSYGYLQIGKNLDIIDDFITQYNVGTNNALPCTYFTTCFERPVYSTTAAINISNIYNLNLLLNTSYIYSTCLGMTVAQINSSNPINFTIAIGYVTCAPLYSLQTDSRSTFRQNRCVTVRRNNLPNSTCTFGPQSVQTQSLLSNIIVSNKYIGSPLSTVPSNTQITTQQTIDNTYRLSASLNQCNNDNNIISTNGSYSIICYVVSIEPFYLPLAYQSCVSNAIVVGITDYFYSSSGITLTSPCVVRNNNFKNYNIFTTITYNGAFYSSNITMYVPIDSGIINTISILVNDSMNPFQIISNTVVFNLQQTNLFPIMYLFKQSINSDYLLICRGQNLRSFAQNNCNLQISIPILEIVPYNNSLSSSTFMPLNNKFNSINYKKNIIYSTESKYHANTINNRLNEYNQNLYYSQGYMDSSNIDELNIKQHSNYRRKLLDITYGSEVTAINDFSSFGSASTSSSVPVNVFVSEDDQTTDIKWKYTAISLAAFIGIIVLSVIVYISFYYICKIKYKENINKNIIKTTEKINENNEKIIEMNKQMHLNSHIKGKTTGTSLTSNNIHLANNEVPNNMFIMKTKYKV